MTPEADPAATLTAQRDRVLELLDEAEQISTQGETPASLDEAYAALRSLTAMRAQVLYPEAAEKLTGGEALERKAQSQTEKIEDIIAELDHAGDQMSDYSAGVKRLKGVVEEQGKADDEVLEKLHEHSDEPDWSELGGRLLAHQG
jgi:hypothetical protein